MFFQSKGKLANLRSYCSEATAYSSVISTALQFKYNLSRFLNSTLKTKSIFKHCGWDQSITCTCKELAITHTYVYYTGKFMKFESCL